MTWISTAIGVGGSLLGGFLNSKGGEKQQQAAQQMSQADRDFYERMYKQSLSDNRANQTSDFGSLTWAQDPQTGKWTQTTSLNPAEQARLGDWRQIAADRMNAAKGLSANFAQGATNWDALGLGKIASAAGVQGGGNSDAIADARAGMGVIGQPSWGRGQMGGPPPMRGMPPPGGMPPGGGMPGGPPSGSAGGGFLGGQAPTPQGPPQGGPPPGGPGPAGLPGGRQPYQPAPVTPQPPAPTGPPPSPQAPPPQAAGPDPAQQANLRAMLNSGHSQGLSNEMFNHFGGDAMLKEMQKLDPNAKFSDVSIGGGGEGAGPSQMGRRLDFDPRVLAQLLRG